jgi:hypothetical protein
MTRLGLELLDSRLAPGTVIFPPPFLLTGHGAGSFTREVGIPEGQKYHLLGSATLNGLGRVAVTGSVESVGFILHGHAWGVITLSNAKGSVTLLLEGPEQGGFAPLPRLFTFDVTGGTGSYRQLNEHGTLQLVITPGTPAHGTFTLAVGLAVLPLG